MASYYYLQDENGSYAVFEQTDYCVYLIEENLALAEAQALVLELESQAL